MAEASVPEPRSVDNTKIDYYDIMVVGLTGQGKSTTADKILIANPEGKDYNNNDDQMQGGDDKKKTMEDLTMWMLSDVQYEIERVTTRLKNLVFFRKLENPHNHINESREADMHIHSGTTMCELFSNETTGVRVLDVPGFFGTDLPREGGVDIPLASSLMQTSQSTSRNHLALMRKILRIQAAMKMKFKRILYFLPVRGPIEKTNMILQQELQLMAHYFGSSIFQCMVLVATMPSNLRELKIPDETLFPRKSVEQTKEHFKETLKQVLPDGQDLPDPPLVFLSLDNTCEIVLRKVKDSDVAHPNGLQLQFESTICARCSMRIRSLRDERVTCAFDRDRTMPYEDSTCHPILVPKYSTLQRVRKGMVHIVTMRWRKEDWPDFSTEICPACKREAGEVGCLRVGQEYVLSKGGGTIIVHHSSMFDCYIEEHRELEQPYQDGGSEEGSDGDENQVVENEDQDVAEPVLIDEEEPQQNPDPT